MIKIIVTLGLVLSFSDGAEAGARKHQHKYGIFSAPRRVRPSFLT